MLNKYLTRRKDSSYFLVDCSECHKSFQVPIKPDILKPINCRKCFKELKSKKSLDSNRIYVIKRS